MSDGDALVAAILAEPDDDTARLVYADYLDELAAERGEPIPCPRAEFIRVQCECRDQRVWCLSPVKVNQHSRRRCDRCKVCRAMEGLRTNLSAWFPRLPYTVVAYSHAWVNGVAAAPPSPRPKGRPKKEQASGGALKEIAPPLPEQPKPEAKPDAPAKKPKGKGKK